MLGSDHVVEKLVKPVRLHAPLERERIRAGNLLGAELESDAKELHDFFGPAFCFWESIVMRLDRFSLKTS